MSLSESMYYLIAVLSLLNFGRVLLMLLGSDYYDIKQARKAFHNRKANAYQPLISIIIPAYNEEMGVIRTIESVRKSTYQNYEIIVVDDGSKDRTASMVREYIRNLTTLQTAGYLARKARSGLLRRRYVRVQPASARILLVSQQNGGKGAALNNGIKNYAKGDLVMVVDADSLVHRKAVERMVAHFRDPMVMAAASNVKVIPSKTVLGVAQRIEYLISYRMKRSLTTLGMEYIIGGVGSTFRRNMLLECNLYDTDTMTEDIDLTLKLIKKYGNKQFKVHYAADALTYTEHVLSFRSLVKQRYRWKFGRFQSLLKNRSLMLSHSKDYSRQLTWYQLPYALLGEFILLLEPILVLYILVVTIEYLDITSLLWVYSIVSSFVLLMMLGEDSESFRTKAGMSLILPFVYFLMYILTAVEFLALIKSIRTSKQLFSKERIEGSWEHVERSGTPLTIPV